MPKAIFTPGPNTLGVDMASVDSMHPEKYYDYYRLSSGVHGVHYALSSSQYLYTMTCGSKCIDGYVRCKRSNIGEHSRTAETQTIYYGVQRSVYDGDNWRKTHEFCLDNPPEKISIDFWRVRATDQLEEVKYGFLDGGIVKRYKFNTRRGEMKFATRVYYQRDHGSVGLKYIRSKMSTKHVGVGISGHNFGSFMYNLPVEQDSGFSPLGLKFDAIKDHRCYTGAKRLSKQVVSAFCTVLQGYSAVSIENDGIMRELFLNQFSNELQKRKHVRLSNEICDYEECFFYHNDNQYRYELVEAEIESLFEEHPNLYYDSMLGSYKYEVYSEIGPF